MVTDPNMVIVIGVLLMAVIIGAYVGNKLRRKK
jgi:hypothetical protein